MFFGSSPKVTCLGAHFFGIFFKIRFFTKIALQEPSWTELGANFGAQEAQMGAQEAPKAGPKNDQKNVQNKI